MKKTRCERFRDWGRGIQRDVVALWLAARDPRVPWYAKLLAAMVAAYALSPIDLIPDFVPILGYLDDLLIVPAGIWATVKLIPRPVMAELRVKALEQRRPTTKVGMAIVLTLWLAAFALTVWLLWPAISGAAKRPAQPVAAFARRAIASPISTSAPPAAASAVQR